MVIMTKQEIKQKTQDEPEHKMLLKFTIVGVNRAEKQAIIKAFTDPHPTNAYVSTGPHGTQNWGSTNLSKAMRLHLEGAGLKITTETTYTPEPKTKIAGMSVMVNANGTYVGGVIVSIVCVGADKKELRDAMYKVESKMLGYMGRYDIPLARMCISQDMFCVIKYTDDKTKYADLIPVNGKDGEE